MKLFGCLTFFFFPPFKLCKWFKPLSLFLLQVLMGGVSKIDFRNLYDKGKKFCLVCLRLKEQRCWVLKGIYFGSRDDWQQSYFYFLKSYLVFKSFFCNRTVIKPLSCLNAFKVSPSRLEWSRFKVAVPL